MTAHRARAYTSLLGVILMWGVATSVIKYTLDGIEPLPFLTYRFALSGIVAIFILTLTKHKHISHAHKNIGLLVLYGLLAFPVALGALFVGLTYSTVLNVTVITMFGPLLTTWAGHTFFHDRITKRERIGIGIAFAGVFFVSVLPALGGTMPENFLVGNTLFLVYLLADMGSTLLGKYLLRKKVPPTALSNIGILTGAATFIGASAFLMPRETLTQITSLSLPHHIGVWYMALFSGSLAYFLLARANKSIEVSESALFFYLMPVISVPVAILWLGETITPAFVFGALLVAVGVFVAEKK